MSKYTLGFIGAGNMGGALALAASRGPAGKSMIISDKDGGKALAAANELGCECADNLETVKNCKYIFLGVKPQYLDGLLKSIAPELKKRGDRFIIVSMAAGIKIRSITDMLGADYPVIRIMPNTPCRAGEGMILYCANEHVSGNEIDEFKTLMEKAGRFDELPEALMDAGCAISGCGPAFAYMFIDALADGGVAAGLTKDKAVLYAAQTVLGAAKMVLEENGSPSGLKDAVCSPGGSTIAGVKALESHAFRAAAMDAVSAALEKTRELGKPNHNE